ncbi:hypothetical protein [Gloeobacter kilaueensis]|uniref:Uncharacterized protein n=1 Tax=Gloeobacter kilaueensis (strain ATCC BAA-2537 / CCAP 1431/1 / ULC 316 / JS1) TaxID=1183438 RepID=U5QS74_GLOK1|nr:hypothetical protein [Gloeobacter kilaueensis]AGY60479.1 hypothetical protein GKIL_4233 [Gloeobacter kilaueensis JS1]
MKGAVLGAVLLLATSAPAFAADDHGFWVATDNSAPLAAGMVDYLARWQQEVPSLRLLLVFSKENRLTQALDRLRPLSLPVGLQTIGVGYEQDVGRIWEQADYSHPDSCAVLGPQTSQCCEPEALCASSLHMAAMLAPSYARVWQGWLDFARTRPQIFTVSYSDSVWPWATRGVPGRAGYSPTTQAAFRTDLAGRDEKLLVLSPQGAARRLSFADYAAFYLGEKPTPAYFGVSKWSEWQPPATALQMMAIANRNRPVVGWSHDPQLTLFDLLVSYEWLKFQQRLALYARERRSDLSYQLIANPEAIGVGTDFKWLMRLAAYPFAAQEWFVNSSVVDGAYVNAHYYTDAAVPRPRVGISLEAGEGGNGTPYHDVQTAYALAYDLGAAVNASWLEGDFLPQMPPTEMVRLCFSDAQHNCQFYRRALGLRAYGLGYQDYQRDAPVPRPSALLAITSRNLFRPYSIGFRAWEWSATGNYETTLGAVVELGYQLKGTAEDSEIAAALERSRTVFYEPLFALQAGWQRVRQWLTTSQGRMLLTTAGVWQRPILNTRAQLLPAREELLRLAAPKQCSAGAVSGATRSFSLYPLAQPAGWQTLVACGSQPLVSVRPLGRGRIVFLHFDPSEPAVRESPLMAELYRALLPRLGLVAPVQATGANVHLYSTRDYQIAAVRSRALDKPGSWRSPDGTPPIAVTLQAGKANQDYHLRMLLNNEEMTLRTDRAGWLRFNVPNRYELVFLQPATKAETAAWRALRERSRRLGSLFAAETDPSTWTPGNSSLQVAK